MAGRYLLEEKSFLWSIILLFVWIILPMSNMAKSVDSLELLISSKKLTQKETIEAYKELSEKYSNINLNKAIDFGKRGLRFTIHTKNRTAEAQFYEDLGLVYLKRADYDSAIICLDRAMPIALELQDRTLEGTLHRAYGGVHLYQDDYDRAMERFKKSAKILEEINNDYELCRTYSAIGGLYKMLNNADLALAYYKKAEPIALKTGHQRVSADVYLGLSSIYRKEDKSLDRSIGLIKKAVDIYRQLKNRYGESQSLAVLASTYNYFGQYDKALQAANQSLQLSEKLDFPNLTKTNATIISATSYYIGRYKETIDAALKAIEIDSSDVNLSKHAFIHLSLAHGQLGQMDSMEHYVNLFFSKLQEQNNENNRKAISELEIRYQTEKKELKIDSLVKQRRLYIWLGIAAGTLLLATLSFALVRYRLAESRRRLAEEETQRIKREKQLVVVQATLDGEAAERTRLAKDLHDGLGGMLSAVRLNLPQIQVGSAVLESVDVNRFQRALGMLDDSIQELRRVAHHMMPESLLRYGLKVSLTDFCTAIPIVEFHYFGDEIRLPEKLEVMVYRCIHELVNNALKHAQATQINVQLVQEADRLSFTVQDNGSGFDLKTVKEGMGLHNIRQRVAVFEGKLNIYSSMEGTEVHVELELSTNGQDN